MKVIHSKTGIEIGKNIKVANSFWSRLTGFMFRKSAHPYDGIYFQNCSWVHNSFVQFPIDLVFINKTGDIIAIQRNFKPWRFSKIHWNADHVIEFPIGILPPSIKPGEHLLITPSPK